LKISANPQVNRFFSTLGKKFLLAHTGGQSRFPAASAVTSKSKPIIPIPAIHSPSVSEINGKQVDSQSDRLDSVLQPNTAFFVQFQRDDFSSADAIPQE
jgi:hypothetical protein